jgi:hypothetical protein
MRRKNTWATPKRKLLWRQGAVVALALTGTAFMTAIAVAGIGSDSRLPPERALQRTIVRQRVAQGLPATPPAPPAAEQVMTKEGILAAVDGYEAEMNAAIQSVEAMKKAAYASKDIIKVNYMTGKIDEMKQLQSIIQPAIDSIRQPGLELFVMQAKLSTIRQGIDELKKKASEAAGAQGESVSASMQGFESTPGETGTGDGLTDPPPPPVLTSDVGAGRPTQASPYK